jgi:hypothetical protein
MTDDPSEHGVTLEELSRLLSPRSTPDRSVCDGGPLPRRGTAEYPTADALYDALSEMLRVRPRNVGEAYGVIREADRLLTALDLHIKNGGPLPSPWRYDRGAPRVR